jgi:hypothetical protein
VRSKEDELAATTHELRLRELDTQRMEGELRAFQTLEPEVTQLRQQLGDLHRQLERERVAHERELRDVKEVHKTAGGWGLHLCVCLRPKDCISPEARLIGRAPAHIYGAPPVWCFVADTQDMFQYRGALEREFQAMTANFVQPKLASSGGSSFSDLGRTSSPLGPSPHPEIGTGVMTMSGGGDSAMLATELAEAQASANAHISRYQTLQRAHQKLTIGARSAPTRSCLRRWVGSGGWGRLTRLPGAQIMNCRRWGCPSRLDRQSGTSGNSLLSRAS